MGGGHSKHTGGTSSDGTGSRVSDPIDLKGVAGLRDPIFGSPSFMTLKEVTSGYVPLKTTGSRGAVLTYTPGAPYPVRAAMPASADGPTDWQLWKLSGGGLVNKGASLHAGKERRLVLTENREWAMIDGEQSAPPLSHLTYNETNGQFTVHGGKWTESGSMAMNQADLGEFSVPYFTTPAPDCPSGSKSCDIDAATQCVYNKPWWWGNSDGGKANCNRNALWVSDASTGLFCCGTTQGPTSTQLCEYCSPDYMPILDSSDDPSGLCPGNPSSICPSLMTNYCEKSNYGENCIEWLSADNYKTLKRQVAEALVKNYADKHGFNPDDDFWSKKAPAICMSNPGVCDDTLSSLCAKYKREDMGKNSNLQALCGCHLPNTREDTQYIYSNEIPFQCDPICGIDQPGHTTIPKGKCDPNNPTSCEFIKCTDTTCVIDDVVIDMINSDFGNMTFAQACSQCNKKKGGCSASDAGDCTTPGGSSSNSCSCYLSNITEYIKNSKVGDIDFKQGCGPCFEIKSDGTVVPSGLCKGQGPTPGPSGGGTKVDIPLLLGTLGGVAVVCIIVVVIIAVVSFIHRSNASSGSKALSQSVSGAF